jgi:hypothetical protein
MRPDKRAGVERLPRRGTDRLEDAAAWLVVAAGLLVVLLAGSIGLGVHAAATERVRLTEARLTEVIATALQDAPTGAAAPDTVAPPVLVEASWTGPDGVTRTGAALMPALTKTGQQVRIWVDREGAPVDEPTGPIGPAVAALTSALVVLLVGGLVLTTAWVGVRCGIGALNDRRWEREWARVGPEWTGHGGDHRRDLRGGRPTD